MLLRRPPNDPAGEPDVEALCCCFLLLFFFTLWCVGLFFFFNRGNSIVRPLGPNSPYLEEGLCVLRKSYPKEPFFAFNSYAG